ncbi:hypothetical protein PFISCL1PPCAC_1278 [Pristionchus fissidentatus]|uniref:Ribosomal protein n=1 Tax=Pristionchus fissidentatus TaxID=1538716 RepID=A0AAV5UU10_9BILA|nr:hypothetical protein PFISCL1PPCAC_1278 [Pristionchus fissidentatus]
MTEGKGGIVPQLSEENIDFEIGRDLVERTHVLYMHFDVHLDTFLRLWQHLGVIGRDRTHNRTLGHCSLRAFSPFCPRLGKDGEEKKEKGASHCVIEVKRSRRRGEGGQKLE